MQCALINKRAIWFAIHRVLSVIVDLHFDHSQVQFCLYNNNLVCAWAAQMRTLVSWIGTTDLLSMAAELEGPARDRVLRNLGFDGKPKRQDGPIRTLLNSQGFQSIHLISNFSAAINRQFEKWIGSNAKIHRVKLEEPTDYAGIFDGVSSVIAEIDKKQESALSIFLSPGTPAMTAVWILIGKSRQNVEFWQTFDGKARKANIPFDIVASFGPALAQTPDSGLQHLAAQKPAEIPGFEDIVGSSQQVRFVAGRAAKAARRDVPILIIGESGTGKEMFARAIHEASSRRSELFFPINCAAIPKDLLEADLFGYAKGAFTGATTDRLGAFSRADNGTIFLDEIGECSPELQAKLLRVLQPPPGRGPCHREFTPVGGNAVLQSDVRLIAATNKDLVQESVSGHFREDLFYRLAVIKLKLPPLRDRKTDIPALTTALLDEINAEFRSQEPAYEYKSLSESAIRFVRRYDWPGNIRQLRNSLVEAAVMSENDTIGVNDIKAAIADVPGRARQSVLDHALGNGFSLQRLLEDVQRQYLSRAMEEAGGVKTRAAELLGIANYQTLDAQLKRLGVQGNW